MVADIQATLAADPNCAATATARLLGATRFLQTSTTGTTTAPASGTAPTSNSTAPAASNTTAPASNNTAPADNATAASNSTTPAASNSTATAASNSTAPNASNTTAPASNTTAPTSNTTAPTSKSTVPATNTTKTNTTVPATNTTKNDNKDKKKKSIADVTFSGDLAAYIADVQTGIKNSSEILFNSLTLAVNSTTKKIKCDFVGVLSSSMKNAEQLKFIKTQYYLAKGKKPCNDTFIVYATNAASAGAGFIGCVSGCEVKPIEWKSNKVLEYFTAAAGCVNGKRFAFAYSKDKVNGEFFDFVAPQFNVCADSAGQSNQSAKYFANLGKASNTLRYLQGSTTGSTPAPATANGTAPAPNNTTTNTTAPTTNTTAPTTNTTAANTTAPVTPTKPVSPAFDTNNCVTAMKSTCQSAFNKFCKDSGLFNNIGNLVPTASGSNLPVDCQNIDAVNPDYTACFTWIARNIIRNSLFPRYGVIAQIQSTIVNSQVVAKRYLQTSDNVKIVAVDPTSVDSAVQMNSTVYAVSDSDANIDGSTASSQAATDAQVSNIVVDNSTAQNTTNPSGSANYLTVSSVLLLVFASLI